MVKSGNVDVFCLCLFVWHAFTKALYENKLIAAL